MAGLDHKKGFLQKLTHEQKIELLSLRRRGTTYQKLSAWLQAEHGVLYRYEVIGAYCRSDEGVGYIKEITERLHEEAMDCVLAASAMRVSTLDEQALKLKDYLDGFDFTQATNKNFLVALREFRRTIKSIKEETDGAIEVEHRMVSPFEEFFKQAEAAETAAKKATTEVQ